RERASAVRTKLRRLQGADRSEGDGQGPRQVLAAGRTAVDGGRAAAVAMAPGAVRVRAQKVGNDVAGAANLHHVLDHGIRREHRKSPPWTGGRPAGPPR